MNEWGIPDWRDPLAYGEVSKWSVNRWRWEFYRRREDLRAFFDENAEFIHRMMSKIIRPPDLDTPDSIDFSVPVGRFSDELRRFGYYWIPNPRFGNQPEWSIIPHSLSISPDYILGSRRYKDFAKVILAALESTGATFIEDDVNRIVHSLPGASVDGFVNKDEIGFVFEIDKPLGPQLAEVKACLSHLQIKRCGKILQGRRHESKWFGYLRTLDARADGATWAQIAELHPATARTEQTARDIWEAANALRFNF